MYISHSGQQAIHQDIVNDGLMRSERRRMLKESRQDTATQSSTWHPRATVTGLVRFMLAAVVRP